MRYGFLLLALVAALVVSVVPAAAQAVTINPNWVEFNASADHAISIDGQAMVTKYELRVMLTGTTAVIATQDLGKPTPAAPTGLIKVALNLPTVPRSSTIRYVGIVYAMGPTGEAASNLSNPFMYVGPPAAPGTPAVSR